MFKTNVFKMAECKYYKLVRQVSYDSGVTWISLDEYQKGDLYENDSPDCGGGITQYKWVNVSGEYTCVGTTKYQKTKKQQSTDGGQTWTDVNPPEYNTGSVIAYNSPDCVASSVKFSAAYNNGQSYSLECNSSAVLSQSDTKPSGYDKTKMTSAIIGNCVTSIGDYALGGFESLTSVTIPNTVTSIGYMSFTLCDKLTSITIPSGVTSIGDDAFGVCSGLTSVTFAQNSQLRIISANCFVDCDNLRSITIPNGTTTIGAGAFWGCDKLTDVSIPNSVTTIGADAFGYCRVLSGVTIPSGVTVIGDYTFQRCNALKTITFPSGTTSIGHGALYYCTSLNRITCLATTPPTLDETAFYHSNNAPIYVPSQSVDAYKSASGWSNYSSRIRAI